MIRLVVAVLVGAAVVSAAMPAVEQAATARADARLDRFGDRLAGAAERVARSSPVPVGVAGARETVRLRVPTASLTTSGVSRVRLRCVGPQTVAVGYTLAGDRRRRLVSTPVPVAVGDQTGGDGEPGHDGSRSSERRNDDPSDRGDSENAGQFVVRLGFQLLADRPTITVRSVGPERSNRKPGPVIACSTVGATRQPVGAGPR